MKLKKDIYKLNFVYANKYYKIIGYKLYQKNTGWIDEIIISPMIKHLADDIINLAKFD